MVGSQAQKSAVGYVHSQHGLSERRACELIQAARSTYRYRPVEDKDQELREKLKAHAYKRKTFGYRRLHVLLKKDGYKINRKKIYRLYKEEGLNIRRKKKKHKLGKAEKVAIESPRRPNQHWAMDFMSDSLTNGRKIRSFNIVDIFSRECPAIELGFSMPAIRVVEVLEKLSHTRGLPELIRVDNGPEYISEALLKWSIDKGIKLEHITPGKPTENGHIESFNGKFREECLNQNAFGNILEARITVEEWRKDYNEHRPHSALGYKTPAEFLMEYGLLTCSRTGREHANNLEEEENFQKKG